MTPKLIEHPQVIGQITAVDSTSVTIHTDLGEDTRLPRQYITGIAVSEGTTRGKVSVVHAAFAGLVVGAVAGRLAIPEHPENARQSGFRYAVKGGVIGSLAGAMFGAVNRPERWETVVLRGGTTPIGGTFAEFPNSLVATMSRRVSSLKSRSRA